MRFADYIVSYSLQINNRCLRSLADNHARTSAQEPIEMDEGNPALQPVYAESALLRDSRRLVAMWRLMHPCLPPRDDLDHHTRQLFTVTEQLHAASAPARLAMRMAGQAVEEDDGKDLLMLARGLPRRGAIQWGYLNELYALDSAWWRDHALFCEIADEDLARQIAKDYRRAYKLSNQAEIQNPEQSSLNKALQKVGVLTQQSAYRLELLRPGLSDKGKRELWYLEKLADAYRTRDGLTLLSEQIPDAGLRKAVAKRTRHYIALQIEKIDQRVQRLIEAAYALKPKRFNGVVWQALQELGLDEVVKIQPREAGAVETTQAPATTQISRVHVEFEDGTEVGEVPAVSAKRPSAMKPTSQQER